MLRALEMRRLIGNMPILQSDSLAAFNQMLASKQGPSDQSVPAELLQGGNPYFQHLIENYSKQQQQQPPQPGPRLQQQQPSQPQNNQGPSWL